MSVCIPTAVGLSPVWLLCCALVVWCAVWEERENKNDLMRHNLMAVHTQPNAHTSSDGTSQHTDLPPSCLCLCVSVCVCWYSVCRSGTPAC